MGYMFYGCKQLSSLNLKNFNAIKVIYMDFMFYDCSELTSLTLSNFNTSKVVNMDFMFCGCSGLSSLILSNFDTSKVTNMEGMFYGCTGLFSLNLYNFDTSKVTNMRNMFCSCYQLYSLNLNNFDTSNVVNMDSMFYGCSQLSSLNLKSFDTSKVTDMSYMFDDCSQLSSLNLKSFDTSEVTDMRNMFAYCSKLSSLNLSNFNISKVEYMDDIFYGCSQLVYLNIKNFIDHNSFYPYHIFEEVPDNIVVCLGENSNKILTLLNEKKNYKIDCSGDEIMSPKEEIEYYDNLMENIEDNITSKDFNTSNLDKGNDEIYETENAKITITTSDNQKNNLNGNTTNIDLGQCEVELKKFYNLTGNETVYMKKIDITQEGMRIPKIEYVVYSKLNGDSLIKLNISICNKNNVFLYVPVIIIGNLDQLNKNSDYYNDICYTAKSESGTDITPKDRQREYINKTVCQDDCDFDYYNDTSQKAICSCKAKGSSSSFIDMNIDGDELIKNFKIVYNYANFNLLICVKKLFSKEGIIKKAI